MFFANSILPHLHVLVCLHEVAIRLSKESSSRDERLCRFRIGLARSRKSLDVIVCFLTRISLPLSSIGRRQLGCVESVFSFASAPDSVVIGCACVCEIALEAVVSRCLIC